MMRWLILIGVVVLNIGAAFGALMPMIVTWAETVPVGVRCSTCSSPEVQTTLIRAAH